MDSLVLTCCKSTVTHKFPHSGRWPDDCADGRGWAWQAADVSTRDLRPAAEKSRIPDLQRCRLTFFHVFYSSLWRLLTSVDFWIFFFFILWRVDIRGLSCWALGARFLQCFVTISFDHFGVHVSAPAGPVLNWPRHTGHLGAYGGVYL